MNSNTKIVAAPDDQPGNSEAFANNFVRKGKRKNCIYVKDTASFVAKLKQYMKLE